MSSLFNPELAKLSPIKRVVPANHGDISFTPMSYSIIDRDEASMLRKYNHPGSDATLTGIEKSNISWQLPPQELSLFSHVPSTFPKQNSNQQNHHMSQKHHEPTDCSFTPMSYSIIDKDEASILKKYNIPYTDATLTGIESSNIPWELPANDLSLFNHIPSTFHTKKTSPRKRTLEEKPRHNNQAISGSTTFSTVPKKNHQPTPSNSNMGRSSTMKMAPNDKSGHDQAGRTASSSVPSITEIMEELRRLPEGLSASELADHLLSMSSGDPHSAKKEDFDESAVHDESCSVPSMTAIMNRLKQLPDDLSESGVAECLMNMTGVHLSTILVC
ncbi:Hypothetical protein NTJ_03913 [Nesidiocoris tenuis]|uniref:Uncharacterized protein n=1 Tax=Nesidiocoris tenuis TaxID=355587 RepID=A0ABN7AFQ3_9HEMI|nr:Hypothetical protein NTJ_03913 [Nesidiocoris tenuis]